MSDSSSDRPWSVADVKEYCCQLLSRREYSAAELMTRAARRCGGARQAGLVQQALSELQADGLQSDRRALDSLIASHADWGSARIALAARQRGIAQDLIDGHQAALACENPTRARAVLARRYRDLPAPVQPREQQRALAFLARRGFDYDVARDALREFLEASQ